ncbi:putative Rieske 2Fe-2S iron-sulfur protein YhfW [Lentibacillus sp. JNUCC-1]|uniref:FAD-dependent oxidoreductase n=1 Tax=Lentibacillus sp. JNUCC-1 TaxID=2654513 RepID=UPI0013282D1B|nr:FAD-dependent oxidoreductase [Lentibacillus sp. JNUCC-1]MUV39836.1 putative Rieske 2Fe-2S iron-sulfur protein YhfW [Lentibacillus sp. JNUCC-1]
MNSKMPQFPESYWRKSAALKTYSKLEETIQTEVAIVGGGITGITAAYMLAQKGVDVVLIDAGPILEGTTGHTTGKITAQHGLIYDELIQHIGVEKAKQYYQANTKAIQIIQSISKEHQINCDLKTEDAFIYTNAQDKVAQLAKEEEAYQKLGIQGEIVQNMPLDVPYMSALKMSDQAQFHPLKYLTGVLEQAIAKGLKVYENTAAIDIEYQRNPAVVTRDGHRIHCEQVIQASHYPFYDGEAFFPTRMYAERAYIIAVKSPTQFPGGMYINAEQPTRSIREVTIYEEPYWLIAGENHKTGQGISTIKHYEALETFAKEHFSIEELQYRWSAQDLTTLDKLPYIGPVTRGQNRVFVATGFRKWGMTHGTIAAKMITDFIVEGDSPYAELYTPSRFQADPSLRKLVSFNTDVAKHLIKGKLEFTNENVKNLTTDEATITRINGKRTGVYKDQEEKLFAVDTTCTHLGCEVEWNSGDRTWDCPCHGSRFTYTGDIVNGPATEPLKQIDIQSSYKQP